MKLKKFLAGLVALVTVSTMFTGVISNAEMISLPAGEYIYGDVNLDGSVKSNDLLMLKKHLLGLEVFDADGNEVDLDTIPTADITHDGAVKSNDLLQIKKVILGLEDEETFIVDVDIDTDAIVNAASIKDAIITNTVEITSEDGIVIEVVDVPVVSQAVVEENAKKLLLAVDEYSKLTDEEKAESEADIQALVDALNELVNTVYENLDSLSMLIDFSLVTINADGTITIDDSVADVFDNTEANITSIVKVYNELIADPNVDIAKLKAQIKAMFAQVDVTIAPAKKDLIMNVITTASGVMAITGTDLTAEQLIQILAE